jgi:carbonic anhydrase
MTFPFVSERVADGRLQLHGVWKDITDGELDYYESDGETFQPV